MTAGVRREIDENCALLGHYVSSSVNLRVLPTFRDNLLVHSSGLKIGLASRLYRNFGKELALPAA